MPEDAALIPVTGTLVQTQERYPSIQSMRDRMVWMGEMRGLLLEYVQKNMDPERHFYTFENNQYKRLGSAEEIQALLKKGQKPALNQDGANNLLNLYEASIIDEKIEETREEGHYSCRVTLTLGFFGNKQAVGVGSCSTRESRYAYRWVRKEQVPAGVDREALKMRTGSNDRGKWEQYRVLNDDVADQENTVLKMAFKRAKSTAVQSLPCVSELFASIGDPDESTESEQSADVGRQEALKEFGAWVRKLKAAVRPKAILALFGEPMTLDEVSKLEEERLRVALQRAGIAEAQEVSWDSPTLLADLKAALVASAKQAQEALFGDQAPAGASATTPGSAATLPVVEQPAQKAAPFWADTLTAHRELLHTASLSTDFSPEECRTMARLVAEVDAAVAGTVPESKGLALADSVLQWVEKLTEPKVTA